MKKIIKVLLILCIVFGLLLVAAVIVLPRVIDPNNYREQIVKLVHDQTGMDLVIDGDIGMSVFPWLGLTTGQLILSDPDLSDSPSLLQVKSAQIRVKLLPLLKKEVEADTVVLDGLKLNLVTEKDGKTNWSKLTGGGSESSTEEKSPAQAAVIFAVAGLKINDGMFLWDNKKAGQNYLLSNLNLQSGVIKPGKPASLHLSGNLSSTVLPKPVDIDTDITVLVNKALNGATISNLSFSASDQAGQKGTLKLAKADIDLQKQRFQLSGINLDTAGLPVNGTLKASSADIDLDKQTVEVPDLDVNSDAGSAQLSASVKKLMVTPAVYSKFKLNHLDLGKILPLLGGEQPEILGQLKDINLSGTVGYDNDQVALNNIEGFLQLAQPGVEPLDILYRANKADLNLVAQTLEVPEISVNSDVVKLTASASGRYNPDNPDLKGQFSLPGMNPKTLLKMLDVDVPTSDPKALTDVALNSAFHYTKSGISLSSLKGKLDDTPIDGSATVRLSPDLGYRFDLKLGKLNADRYLPPAGQDAPAHNAAASNKAAGKAASGAEQLAAPVSFASTLDADGKIALEQLKIEGLTVDNILLSLKAKGGLVNMSSIKAKLYQGQLNGNASFDARPKQPVIGAKLNLTDMQIGGLLKELNITDKLEAKGQASTDIRMVASDKAPLINTLSGPVSFSLKDGLIRGFDLRKIIVGAQELVNQTKYKGKLDKLATDAQGDKSDEFRFTAMSGSMKFNRGVGHNDDLDIKSPLFRIGGEGDVDIPDSKIDYHMDVHVVESLKGQGGENLDNLRGADIPVWIHGSLEAPGFRVDLQRLLKRELEKKLDKEKEKYKEKLQDKLEKAIQKNLGKSGDQDATRDLGKQLLDKLFK